MQLESWKLGANTLSDKSIKHSHCLNPWGLRFARWALTAPTIQSRKSGVDSEASTKSTKSTSPTFPTAGKQLILFGEAFKLQLWVVSEAPKLDLPCQESGIQEVLPTPFPRPLGMLCVLDPGARIVCAFCIAQGRDPAGHPCASGTSSVTGTSQRTRTEKEWNHSTAVQTAPNPR